MIIRNYGLRNAFKTMQCFASEKQIKTTADEEVPDLRGTNQLKFMTEY